eukprot:scaffold923_cov171-Amphora_coffeaeformis.AAC.12
MMNRRHPRSAPSTLEVPLAGGTQEGGVITATTTAVRPATGRRKRKHGTTTRNRTPQQRQRERLWITVEVLLSLLVAGYILQWFFFHNANDNAVLPVMDPRVQQHMPLYRARRKQQQSEAAAATETTTNTWPLPFMTREPRPKNVLLSDYHPSVLQCSVTLLFLDPRLADPKYGSGGAAWFALESAAAFMEEHACMALVTTSCAMETHLENIQDNNNDNIDAETAVRDMVYASALPLLRGRIHEGRVRLSFLSEDHAQHKYHLQSCVDFGNPTPALLHYHFWNDEFVAADADAVLTLQDDAVLCRPLQAKRYAEYAFVGAVWPKTATPLLPNPPEGMCWGMPSLWKLLMLRVKRNNSPDEVQRLGILPSYPDPCSHGNAPIGNGGLSWRLRSWMQRAIVTVPHAKWSGLHNDTTTTAARVMDDSINEDYYFGTVLRGIGAPLPTARVAGEFATESLFPAEVMAMYGNGDDASGATTPEVSLATIPIGFHKPWWYHSNEVLLSPTMQQACPFLPFIFEPKMSRWEEVEHHTV